MKTEAQRIAIAQACGFRFAERTLTRPSGEAVTAYPLYNQVSLVPDYLSDMNAALTLCVALAEQGYGININKLTAGWVCNFIGNDGLVSASAETLSAAICEAFLRTLNLWTETP